MNQIAIQFWPTARKRDPVTSHLAATQARQLASAHQRDILSALELYGPAGKDAIAMHAGLSGVMVARRLPELQRMGRIKLTGRLVTSNTGRMEREWMADEGCYFTAQGDKARKALANG